MYRLFFFSVFTLLTGSFVRADFDDSISLSRGEIVSSLKTMKRFNFQKEGDFYEEDSSIIRRDLFLVMGEWKFSYEKEAKIDIVFKFKNRKWEIETIGFDDSEKYSNAEKENLLSSLQELLAKEKQKKNSKLKQKNLKS